MQHEILGQVYLWYPDELVPLGGSIKKETVVLPEMDCSLEGESYLSNRFVVIKNGGMINLPVEGSDKFSRTALGDAHPNSDGNFIFDPFNGGGRMDLEPIVDDWRRCKNIQVSRFGEVNTFFHINKIASFVDELLKELGLPSLPRLKVVVNAHSAIYQNEGEKDGYKRPEDGTILPFQGGHYRLSNVKLTDISELHPISPDGEIHLGPGRGLTEHGALPELAKVRYRCNSSHNAGIIYHEYGHHICRHTADFMANSLVAPHLQSNRKSDIDEGISDYWAATMLDCPHIWAWHRKHTSAEIHPRSLASFKTMADFDFGKNADPHLNGTILGATLWNIRHELVKSEDEGARKMDMLVLKSLILIGQLHDSPYRPTKKGTREYRSGFNLMLTALLHADWLLFQNDHSEIIFNTFLKRGINLQTYTIYPAANGFRTEPKPIFSYSEAKIQRSIHHIIEKDKKAIIPQMDEILSREELENWLTTNSLGPFSLTAVGDIMLGERMNRTIKKFGPEYTFYSTYPIFRKSSIVLGNLEGPFARKADKEERNFSYKVDPKNARILRRAGFNVMNLANNHLLDCGRQGVLESFTALKKHGIKFIGAGINEEHSHQPSIMQAGKFKIGLLGYYWNSRTAAHINKPGSAIDSREHLANDICKLRTLADRIVVTIHWGIPYDQFPSDEDQEKAHFAIDCGADIVIGHHPHIIQPFEVYKNRPIFYSIGNFAFGSGNSNAESIVLSVNFEDTFTNIIIFPAYIKNRDQRVNYQPKILTGRAASESIGRLKKISGTSGEMIHFKNNTGKIVISLP